MFKNDPQLQAAILRDLKDIVDEVTEQVVGMLRDSIEKYVYGVATPARYHRNRLNGGLQGSFIKTKAVVSGLKVSSRAYQDYLLMIEHDQGNPKDYTHGSEFWGITDIRELLAGIIIEGRSGPWFGDGFWRRKRDFYSPVITLLDGGELEKMIENAFDKRKIKWKRV
jgi:hypothetical protein